MRKWYIQRQGDPRAHCLIRVYLAWHDGVVKRAVGAVRTQDEEVTRS